VKRVNHCAGLPSIWRQARRRWGHDLHSLCSYMAMFPPALPHVFIQWLTAPADVVYDPFSGRGTTTLQACLHGRIGFGSDANPLAWILTAAKASPPSKGQVERRLRELQDGSAELAVDEVPDAIRVLFDPTTLSQLLWLRDKLSTRKEVDRFLLAVLLGSLHANANANGHPRGLTVAMPNTFAMAPGYVARYVRRHRLRPPRVQVLHFLASRVARFSLPGDDFSRGKAWQQDVRAEIHWPKKTGLAKLIFASPPYLGVMRYAKLNWIRHWLTNTEPHEVDDRLFSSGSLSRYVDFMRLALSTVRGVLRDDGFVCLVIGDVRRDEREIRLAEIVAEACVSATDLRVGAIVEDRIPVERKVSRIWGKTKGRATKTDRILVLTGPKARLPRDLPRVSWAAGA
jgi:hypothetical protein